MKKRRPPGTCSATCLAASLTAAAKSRHVISVRPTGAVPWPGTRNPSTQTPCSCRVVAKARIIAEAMEDQHAGAGVLSREFESEVPVAGIAIGIGMVYVTMPYGVHVALLCGSPQRTRWVNRNARIFGSIATGVLSSPRPVFFGSLSISLDRPVTFDSSRRSDQRLQHDGHVLGMAAASRHPG